MHASKAFELLYSLNLLENMGEEDHSAFRKIVIRLVLDTDL